MEWFFAEISIRRRNCFRFLVCAISLAIVLIYLPIAELVFSKEGLRNSKEVFQIAPSFTLFLFNDSVFFVYFIMATCIMSLSLLAVGIKPLQTSVIGFVTFISLFNRCPHLDYGGSMMMSVALFFQVLQAYCDHYFPSDNIQTCHGWPVKAMQIQLAIIYFFAGLAKMGSPMWTSGEAIARIMNSEQSIFFMPAFGSYPVISTVLSYATMMAEILFIIFVWNMSTRRLALMAMFLMHSGIFLGLHVTVLFTEAFFVLLTSFFTDEEWLYLTRSFYTPKSNVAPSV